MNRTARGGVGPVTEAGDKQTPALTTEPSRCKGARAQRPAPRLAACASRPQRPRLSPADPRGGSAVPHQGAPRTTPRRHPNDRSQHSRESHPRYSGVAIFAPGQTVLIAGGSHHMGLAVVRAAAAAKARWCGRTGAPGSGTASAGPIAGSSSATVTTAIHGSTSTNRGVAPSSVTASAVAMNEFGGTSPSSSSVNAGSALSMAREREDGAAGGGSDHAATGIDRSASTRAGAPSRPCVCA
jgi:hypothetical protein